MRKAAGTLQLATFGGFLRADGRGKRCGVAGAGVAVRGDGRCGAGREYGAAVVVQQAVLLQAVPRGPRLVFQLVKPFQDTRKIIQKGIHILLVLVDQAVGNRIIHLLLGKIILSHSEII